MLREKEGSRVLSTRYVHQIPDIGLANAPTFAGNLTTPFPVQESKCLVAAS